MKNYVRLQGYQGLKRHKVTPDIDVFTDEPVVLIIDNTFIDNSK